LNKPREYAIPALVVAIEGADSSKNSRTGYVPGVGQQEHLRSLGTQFKTTRRHGSRFALEETWTKPLSRPAPANSQGMYQQPRLSGENVSHCRRSQACREVTGDVRSMPQEQAACQRVPASSPAWPRSERRFLRGHASIDCRSAPPVRKLSFEWILERFSLTPRRTVDLSRCFAQRNPAAER